VKILEKLSQEYGVHDLSDINTALSGNDPKKMQSYHIILLAQNQTGLKKSV
jgi:DNA polymerase-3 subunit alpha (Gram-positive type)